MEQTSTEILEPTQAHQPDIFAPDVIMVILTWVTFGCLVVILKKFAWKPILENLQKREDFIRKSLDDADQIKVELTAVEKQKQVILEEAKAQAAQIIQDSRVTARAVAENIEIKAKEHAESIVKSGYSQVAGEYQKVSRQLQQESANIAVDLAGKILKENMDTDKNRRLIEVALKEV